MGITVDVGVELRRPVIRLTENGRTPLLTVASVFPSGLSDMPKGFGAPTAASTPTGVTSFPFGRTAAS